MIELIAVLLFANLLASLVAVAGNDKYVRDTNQLLMRIWGDTSKIKENTKFLHEIDNMKEPATTSPEEENKTYKQRLKEIFPNAVYGNDNLPEVCAGQLFGFECRYGDSCEECWNRTEKERRMKNANS